MTSKRRKTTSPYFDTNDINATTQRTTRFDMPPTPRNVDYDGRPDKGWNKYFAGAEDSAGVDRGYTASEHAHLFRPGLEDEVKARRKAYDDMEDSSKEVLDRLGLPGHPGQRSDDDLVEEIFGSLTDVDNVRLRQRIEVHQEEKKNFLGLIGRQSNLIESQKSLRRLAQRDVVRLVVEEKKQMVKHQEELQAAQEETKKAEQARSQLVDKYAKETKDKTDERLEEWHKDLNELRESSAAETKEAVQKSMENVEAKAKAEFEQAKAELEKAQGDLDTSERRWEKFEEMRKKGDDTSKELEQQRMDSAVSQAESKVRAEVGAAKDQSLKDEQQKWAAEKAILEKERDELKKAAVESKTTIEDLRTKVGKLEADLSSLEASNKTQEDEQAKRIEDLKADHERTREDARKERDRLDGEVFKADLRNNHLTANLNKETVQHQDALNTIKNGKERDVRGEKEKAEIAARSAEDKAKGLEGQIISLQDDVRESRQKLAEAEQDNEGLTNEKNNLTRDVKDAQDNTAKLLREKVGDLADKKKEWSKLLADETDKLMEANAKAEKLSLELEEVKGELSAREVELDDSRMEIDGLNEAMGVAVQDARIDGYANMERLQEQLYYRMGTIKTDLQRKLGEKGRRIEALENEVEARKDELRDAKDAHSAVVEDLEWKVTATELNRQAMEGDRNSVRDSGARTQAELTVMREENRKLDSDLKQPVEERDVFKGNFGREQLTASNHWQLACRNKELLRKAEAAMETLKQDNRETLDRYNTIEQLLDDSDGVQRENERVRQELADLEVEHEDLKLKLHNAITNRDFAVQRHEDVAKQVGLRDGDIADRDARTGRRNATIAERDADIVEWKHRVYASTYLMQRAIHKMDLSRARYTSTVDKFKVGSAKLQDKIRKLQAAK